MQKVNIFFCDADDTISTDTLVTLYNEAEENNFDLIISDKKIIDNHKSLREKKNISMTATKHLKILKSQVKLKKDYLIRFILKVL